MKLIKPSFSILPQSDGLEGIYRQIEMAGRTCYKSEDKITEYSAKEFVDRMIKSGHGAMLEHGTVYLTIPVKYSDINPAFEGEVKVLSWTIKKYWINEFTHTNLGNTNAYITTNLRVLVENGWMNDLQYICEPTEYHEKRHTVKFICDRGVSHEFVRHRVFSFAQESTRYCNYSKDKFGNELTFIEPCWNWQESSDTRDAFRGVLMTSEVTYNRLIEIGWKAQEARAILPNALKTELVMTGFVNDWKHFFELRTAGSAHPQARELAIPLREEFINKGYI